MLFYKVLRAFLYFYFSKKVLKFKLYNTKA
ncbi:hypothetical protein YSQ_03725 [Campylobacter coli RM1875]|nr:hypothetical protein YSQ_03725 [Campylobacter coli RM1875]AHK75921.1 hypothetical protein YSU_03770 [Campylobacter coli RM5611]AHK77784.1 hypothetical protein YSS_05705 [Campylobacter coli RM4661]